MIFAGHKFRKIFILMVLVFILAGCNQVTVSPKRQDDNTNTEVKTQPEPGEVAIIDNNIVVNKPLSNDTITSPLEITGRAKVSEGTVLFRLKDAWENVIASGSVNTNINESDWGYFSGELKFDTPASPFGWLEVYSQNSSDGSELNLIKLPIVFQDYQKPKVKVFYNSVKEDPELKDCSKVYSVEREIDFTNQQVLAALNELFKGVSDQEAKDGFVTNLPKDGIKVQQVELKDGRLLVDFNSALVQGLTGKCKNVGAKAQIIGTLKQFSAVKEVVVSVDGKVDW